MEKHEIRDYKIEIDGREPEEIEEQQACFIIREVLIAFDLPFKEIKVSSEVKYTFEFEEGETSIDVLGEEPKDWYAQANLREKEVEVGINNTVLKIPLFLVLKWFEVGQESHL